MAHLLQAAIRKDLRHIIVVLPYTSIITQSVRVYREALVLDNEDPEFIVAEHDHQADFSSIEARELATTWNAPIIVTTAVQFFETLGTNEPARLRKLHELPGTGIFIDESHAAIPTWLWPQAWIWLQKLTKEWGCHLVLASGTTAKFWDMAQGHGSPLPGVAATILRKNVIVSVPKDEGEKNSQGEVLATHESGKDGFVTFHHLVRHDPNNKSDRYYIKCTPDKMKGDFVFKEKEESYYPLFNNELSGFPFNSASTYNPPPVQGGFNIPITYGEDIIWNHQLDIKTYLDSIALYPAAPRIAGKVEVAEKVDAKAMSDIKVVMINKYKNPTEPTKLFTTVKTNENGRAINDNNNLIEFENYEYIHIRDNKTLQDVSILK